MVWKRALVVILGTLAGVLMACQPGNGTTPPPTSKPLTVPQLQYRLLTEYPDFFWSDPDFYPIGRPGVEEQNAQTQFAETRANAAEFAAILEHLGLPDKVSYTDEEKLLIYRERKLLRVIPLTASGNGYAFAVRTGEGQGILIEGTIGTDGRIREQRRTPSFNTRPICLAAGTLIATPDGPVPVERLQVGMPVWTFDAVGNQVAGVVLKTVSTHVPASFQLTRVTLSDGRTVTASPGHPTADSRALADYSVGDPLDGATVVSTERVPYDGGATYDVLPSGETGYYRAGGVLLGSTLR